MNKVLMYSLDLDKCLALDNMPAIVKVAFYQLKASGYISVGKYFKDMAQCDLMVLSNIVEKIATNTCDQDSTDAIYMLASALLVGEGVILSEKSFAEGFLSLTMYVSCESLFRKGLIDVHRENWTMDTLDAVTREKGIASIRPEGRDVLGNS